MHKTIFIFLVVNLFVALNCSEEKPLPFICNEMWSTIIDKRMNHIIFTGTDLKQITEEIAKLKQLNQLFCEIVATNLIENRQTYCQHLKEITQDPHQLLWIANYFSDAVLLLKSRATIIKNQNSSLKNRTINFTEKALDTCNIFRGSYWHAKKRQLFNDYFNRLVENNSMQQPVTRRKARKSLAKKVKHYVLKNQEQALNPCKQVTFFALTVAVPLFLFFASQTTYAENSQL